MQSDKLPKRSVVACVRAATFLGKVHEMFGFSYHTNVYILHIQVKQSAWMSRGSRLEVKVDIFITENGWFVHTNWIDTVSTPHTPCVLMSLFYVWTTIESVECHQHKHIHAYAFTDMYNRFSVFGSTACKQYTEPHSVR